MFINELLQDGIIEEVQVEYEMVYRFDGKEFYSIDDVEGYILDQMYMDYMRNNKEVIEQETDLNFEITLSNIGNEFLLEIKTLKLDLVNYYTDESKAFNCYYAILNVLRGDVQ